MLLMKHFYRKLQFQELHVDRQLLRPGEHFVMDPRNCLALASCLRVLNISGTNVYDLAGLELMAGLTSLAAASNHLSCLEVGGQYFDNDEIGDKQKLS